MTDGLDDALHAFRLDGRVAAITGGARGIGRAVGELFTAVGARVIVLDRDIEAAQATALALGSQARAHRLDVRDEAQVDAVFDEIARAEGQIDVLVNNAGIAIRRPTLELSAQEWEQVVSVNLTGTFLCARAAGRHMVARGRGAIVNMASIFGVSGGGVYPNISYQASKGAVVNFTRVLAVEWARACVRVNALAPTWVDTDLIAPLKNNAMFMAKSREMTPLGRFASTADVAHACLYLASDAAAMVTGHILPVDGGFLAQ
ncbi:3-oxoacyl-[acyl-carrier protein] reductase [Candidatus Burkholderia verschuerenii]|uniref:3-oxoacyl-[acyl-carrier protein] reductase n=1 Tax=Candidatus Burkholderia verschuerenii TaxID=242163 RepID=A0A0L0MHF1_9BURK|nr:SDR family NAD(P)-dependent oxidoreductase [Candidatus Burkholderia verschuerenii]KND62097.1 3-oxoacyl-[acyl-carrier protein] reductase [Candidatus Burkholderia verschuerenii]